MVNLFDSFFVIIRSVMGEIVYPFHVAFMTKEEINGEFDSRYGELDEPFDIYTHYGLYRSKASKRSFAMPLTSDQYKKQLFSTETN